MSRVLVASGLGFVGSRAIRRLLAAGSELRNIEESQRRVADRPATVEAGDAQPSPGASFIAAGRDQYAEGVDAVAGSEFVDDRIRLQE